MKKVFLIAFMGCIHLLYPQNSGTAEYIFTYQKFEDEPKDDVAKDARKTVELVAEYATEHRYILKFNRAESYYNVEEALPLENANAFAYKFSKMTFSQGIFYQNLKTGEVLNQLTTMGENFLVQSSLQNNWEITTEQKTIGKYTCYKAISRCVGCNNNQEVIAWFTPDIPLSFGPGGYGGTPGLILEITRYRYTLQLIKIKFEDKTIAIEKPNVGIPITAEKLKEEQMERRIQMIKQN